jgi:hypothetical protein
VTLEPGELHTLEKLVWAKQNRVNVRRFAISFKGAPPMTERKKPTGEVKPSSITSTKPEKNHVLDPNAVVIRVQAIFKTPAATGDDGKDGDTALTVGVSNSTGVVFAQVVNYYGEFSNPSTSTVELLILNQCTRGLLTGNVYTTLHIEPNGSDTWDFDYTLVVTFSDGIQSFAAFNGHWLSDDNKDNKYGPFALASL